MLKQLGIKSSSSTGMRVTDAETMDVVEMVLGGTVNKDIVTLISQAGGRRVGLTGQDGAFIRARKLLMPNHGQARGDDRHRPVLGDIGHRPVGDFHGWARGIHPGGGAIGVGATVRRSTSTPTWSPANSPRSLRAEKLVLLTSIAGVLDRTAHAHQHHPRQIDAHGWPTAPCPAACCQRSPPRSTRRAPRA